MAHKVIVPQKKIMSRSFLNSGTLIVIKCFTNDTSIKQRSNNMQKDQRWILIFEDEFFVYFEPQFFSYFKLDLIDCAPLKIREKAYI
jgi:hypothetical protein